MLRPSFRWTSHPLQAKKRIVEAVKECQEARHAKPHESGSLTEGDRGRRPRARHVRHGESLTSGRGERAEANTKVQLYGSIWFNKVWLFVCVCVFLCSFFQAVTVPDLLYLYQLVPPTPTIKGFCDIVRVCVCVSLFFAQLARSFPPLFVAGQARKTKNL